MNQNIVIVVKRAGESASIHRKNESDCTGQTLGLSKCNILVFYYYFGGRKPYFIPFKI